MAHEYIILDSASKNVLAKLVCEKMDEGYEPIGGITVETNVSKKGEYNERTYHVYAQAMVQESCNDPL